MVQSPVGIPGLVAGSEGDKHWPDVGEAMTWVGHVRNMGSGTAGAFDYRWRLGATVLDSGTVAAGLASGAEVTVSLARPFPASAETLVLEVDHDDLVDEDSEINNSLEAGSHDLVMKIWVEQGLYDLFRGGNNLMGTRSFEDWIQAQFVAFNLQAQDAVYTTAPSGIHDRIRIDAIAILPQLDPGNFPINASLDKDFFDGHWSFSDRDMSHAAYFAAFRYGIDWGLLHELAHQVGMIDLYVLNLDNDPANNNKPSTPPNIIIAKTIKLYFTQTFNVLAAKLHADNIARGFWPGDEDRNNAELIALMHSELSEALEALRHNNPPSDHIPEFSGIEEELADCIIRIMDMSAARGYRVAEAIIAKVEFNRSRPYKHGKQF
jgi:NTP pyrophosphatase (non-canonical NTP hydrolase)